MVEELVATTMALVTDELGDADSVAEYVGNSV